ncbi:hypothetical protein ILYODFUR_014426 [Ilyodon furcidens]|uniref:Uncharacterized protein n=1 Tax=Ilyodon furcidens TaxID=33524 RepID=A0ABV0U5R6_9TELE
MSGKVSFYSDGDASNRPQLIRRRANDMFILLNWSCLTHKEQYALYAYCSLLLPLGFLNPRGSLERVAPLWLYDGAALRKNLLFCRSRSLSVDNHQAFLEKLHTGPIGPTVTPHVEATTVLGFYWLSIPSVVLIFFFRAPHGSFTFAGT